MNYIAAILFVVLIGIGYMGPVQAEGDITGPNCSLSWNASSGVVEGYRVYVGPTAANKTVRAQVLTGTTVSCAALSLTAGQNYAHVTGFNAAGESGASTTLPFVLVTSAPGIPGNLRLTVPAP